MNQKEKRNYLKNRGITLISLVVTIIVLIILAGISINLIMGDNGIITKAKQAKEAQTEAEVREKIAMTLAEYAMEREFNNKTLLDFLQEKKNTQEIDEVKDNGDGTITVELNGYEVTIKESNLSIRDIGKAGLRPNISNITITTDGTTIAEDKSVPEGTPLQINFEHSIQGGTTTVDKTLPYITNGTETEVTFVVTGNVNGENYTKTVTISIASKYGEPTMAETPEKSEVAAFSRSYGVIEIEFLEGTSYKTTTTPNEPNLGSNMKKVYWEDDGTERIEGSEGFDATKWYSYTAQTGDTASGGTSKWANAVTVDGEGNITGYFVWIPRYAYRIVYFDSETNENNYRTNGTTTGIVGYSDSRGLVDTEGKTPSDMEEPVTSISVGLNKLRPHPAFEDGSETGYTQGEWNTALEGIWIAKYETSGSSSALKSVPGKKSLRSTTIGNMYTYALNFSTENKSHMLKNSEWGAMTYLTESKYGRNGTAVSQNTNSSYYTAGASGATVKNYPLQSTTGNYYGIYDTVGGAYEYVAGYIADNSQTYGNSFASTDNKYNNKTESTEYSTVYDMVSADATCAENYTQNINQKFGDATLETSTAGTGTTSWNTACSYFVGDNGSNRYPFFIRGGLYNGTYEGSFYFSFGSGNSSSIYSFRLCISVN